MVEERAQRRLAAILAADVVGYSRLVEQDEEGTLSALRERRKGILQPLTAEHHGRIVKVMGDGVLMEFTSAVNAVACAIELQKRMVAANSGTAEDRHIVLRIGINLGDVIVEGGDLYGDAVIIAARLEAIAEAGGIIVSSAAYDQVKNKVKVGFDDLGVQNLKNIAEPVRAYRVVGTPRMSIVAAKIAIDKPSIAVLPFTNMSSDPEQEYFSDGISEDIITDLSKLSELHVIARNSSFVYKRRAVSTRDVARELGVRYVLEGSVRKAGSRVRVTSQLIDSTTGGHIWAERFDRDLNDIFVVQDELTQQIVSALKITLTLEDRNRLSPRHAVSIEAYELFLRGREQTWLQTRTGNIAARNLLDRAITMHPVYAAAHARIAFTHLVDYSNGWSDAPEHSLQTGLEIAQQAVAMDASEPQAHFALAVGCTMNRELDRAIAEAEQCLALLPNSAEGHLAKAQAQIFSGDAAAAIATIEACLQLDPVYPDIALYFLAEAHFSLGEFDQASATLEQRIERNPQSATSYALLASCYGYLGRITESRAAWAEVLEIEPGFSTERRRRILPFRDPEDFERRVQGLRRAGLLE